MLVRHHHSRFSVPLLRARKDCTVSVCLPAVDEERTIGATVDALVALREAGVVDEVVVIDGGSSDRTAELARDRGADVHSATSLMPSFGPVLGKGDSMWRALSVLSGDVVCFVDADTPDFDCRFVRGLLGPLICEPRARFVKAAYRRPFNDGGWVLPEGGGRVTELLARPLLERFYPSLAHFRQPLSGEVAGLRSLFLALPFDTGYAVEVGMLIDVYSQLGMAELAEVDLDERLNRHRSLAELAPMASAVLGAVTRRLEQEGRLGGAAGNGDHAGLSLAHGDQVQRPPMRTALTAAVAG